jgi:hypothetical protein
MKDPEKQTIWAPYQVFYIQSMLFNAESAARSVSQILSVLHVVFENSPEDPVSALPQHYLLGELQNLVVQAAALSRYFWPVKAEHNWRGEHLRKAFGLTEESALRSRGLRNAIEHFDEQLDKYLENGIVGQILPQYVGPFSEPQGVPVHLFRAYYIDTGVFELLGKRYEVDPIAAEVGRIYELLKEMDKSGGMLRAPEGKQQQ